MRSSELLQGTPEGLYCPAGNFHIDPIRPVRRALITHAHSDHARSGHGAVLATQHTLALMEIRYGEAFAGLRQSAVFGQTQQVGGVAATFHPAGHILGSAQICLERNGLRVAVSGDYKRSCDPTAEPFHQIECDVFITEATFGLPVFRHPDPRQEIDKLLRSVAASSDRTHLVGVYALGKAQRVIRLLRDSGYDEPLYIHGALSPLCSYYESAGIKLGELRMATQEKGSGGVLAGNIVLGPPSAFATPWIRRFAEPLIAFASGWMQIRQRIRQRGVELPLVISDHSDWGELTATIRETGASKVWVTHGREEALVRWCALNGVSARPLHLIGYEDEVE
jgi:putative mRNA 3-end processing factor